MVSYCSLSNDRLLTKILIENSNNISSKQSFHNFFNKNEWIDGLDIWSIELNGKINDLSSKNFIFDNDIGLYLPRSNQFNLRLIKSDSILSKGIKKQITAEHSKQFIQKEDNQTTNIIQKQNSNENASNKIRLPLRQIESTNSFRENNKLKENNEEKIEYLSKEELNNLLHRETTNIYSKRTLIRIPLVDIKHQNSTYKSNCLTDSTSIIERYNKIQQLLITPTPNQSTINNQKMFTDNKQLPLFFQGVSTFGLTVTPLDFSSSKNLQNSSQQKQTTNNRPLTQPVLNSSLIEQNDQEQRIYLKPHNDIEFLSSSSDFIISNKNSNDEQIQTVRKFSRHHRFLTKTNIQRAKTMQFLPHVAGTKINVNISNQRNS